MQLVFGGSVIVELTGWSRICTPDSVLGHILQHYVYRNRIQSTVYSDHISFAGGIRLMLLSSKQY